MSYTIATSMASTRKENEDDIARHHQTSHFARFSEWLSQYLREVVQDHGVYSLVVLKGVQPDLVMESLIVRATAVTKASIANECIIQHVQSWRISAFATTMTEILLCRRPHLNMK